MSIPVDPEISTGSQRKAVAHPNVRHHKKNVSFKRLHSCVMLCSLNHICLSSFTLRLLIFVLLTSSFYVLCALSLRYMITMISLPIPAKDTIEMWHQRGVALIVWTQG